MKIKNFILAMFLAPFGVLQWRAGRHKIAIGLLSLCLLQLLLWLFTMMPGAGAYFIPQFCAYKNIQFLFGIAPTVSPAITAEQMEADLVRPAVWLLTLPGALATLIGYLTAAQLIFKTDSKIVT